MCVCVFLGHIRFIVIHNYPYGFSTNISKHHHETMRYGAFPQWRRDIVTSWRRDWAFGAGGAKPDGSCKRQKWDFKNRNGFRMGISWDTDRTNFNSWISIGYEWNIGWYFLAIKRGWLGVHHRTKWWIFWRLPPLNHGRFITRQSTWLLAPAICKLDKVGL